MQCISLTKTTSFVLYTKVTNSLYTRIKLIVKTLNIYIYIYILYSVSHSPLENIAYSINNDHELHNWSANVDLLKFGGEDFSGRTFTIYMQAWQ